MHATSQATPHVPENELTRYHSVLFMLSNSERSAICCSSYIATREQNFLTYPETYEFSRQAEKSEALT